MVGLVPTIHLSASSGASGTLDPRDKPVDDTSIFCWYQKTSSLSPPQATLPAVEIVGACSLRAPTTQVLSAASVANAQREPHLR